MSAVRESVLAAERATLPTATEPMGFPPGLADWECRHGRLHTDTRTARCGCWDEIGDMGTDPVVAGA